MQLECPTCRSLQKLAWQWTAGVNAVGSIVTLKCGHSFELTPRPDLDEG